MKHLIVTAIPTASALSSGVLRALYHTQDLTDRALLKAWKRATTARYMANHGIRPLNERHTQRHVLARCADTATIRAIQAEVDRRGLRNRYAVEIRCCETPLSDRQAGA